VDDDAERQDEQREPTMVSAAPKRQHHLPGSRDDLFVESHPRPSEADDMSAKRPLHHQKRGSDALPEPADLDSASDAIVVNEASSAFDLGVYESGAFLPTTAGRPTPSHGSGEQQAVGEAQGASGAEPTVLPSSNETEVEPGEHEEAEPSSASASRPAMAMAGGTLASRVLGLARNATLTAAIGATGIAANAFDVANNLPNFLYTILAAGVFNSILVPQFVQAYRRGRGYGDEFVNRIFTVSLSALAVLTVVLTLGAGTLVNLYTHGWTPEQTQLAVAFAFWCIPEVFFYGLYMLLGQVLNARGLFSAFAWAPVLNNVISIIGFGLFIAIFGHHYGGSWGQPQVVLLAGTALLGIAVQAVVLFIPLRRAGIRLRPRWGLRGWGLRHTARLGGWVVGALMLGEVATWVVFKMASSAQPAAERAGLTHVAANAALSQANIIYVIPHALVTVSIITAIFTRMSDAAVQRDVVSVREDFSYGLRTIGLFTTFFTAAFIVLAVPLVRLLLPGLQIEDVHVIAQVLVPLAAGLIPTGMTALIQRVFFAFGRPSTVFWIQLLVSLIGVAFSLLAISVLPVQWWVVGIAAAQTISFTVGAGLRLRSLRELLGGSLDGSRVVSTFLRVLAAGLTIGVLGWIAMRLLPEASQNTIVGAALSLTGVGVAMMLVYVGLLKLMHVKELSEFVAPVIARLPGFTRARR